MSSKTKKAAAAAEVMRLAAIEESRNQDNRKNAIENFTNERDTLIEELKELDTASEIVRKRGEEARSLKSRAMTAIASLRSERRRLESELNGRRYELARKDRQQKAEQETARAQMQMQLELIKMQAGQTPQPAIAYQIPQMVSMQPTLAKQDADL